MTILASVFWTSAALILYQYFGYPLFIWAISRWRPRPVRTAPVSPSVTVVIAAYNEERVIREKIEQTLALDYAEGQLEIIVAADGSTDGTVAIAGDYEMRGVKVLHEPPRRGKTSALNRAVAEASGDIILFSDANTIYRPDAVRTIVRSFADSSVGGVSGRKVILVDEQRVASRGEATFWGYEAFVKSCESRAGSIVTGDGEMFAMRRALFEAMPREVVHDDMYLTLRIVERGYRVVYDVEATSAEYASLSLYDELHLKVRYASAGFQIVSMFRHMLVPPRSLFAFEFLSHKVLRWIGPVFLLGVLIPSTLLVSPVYRVALALQVAFYALAALALPFRGRLRIGVLYFPLYFAMGNLAALYGIVRHLLGGQGTQWRRASR